MGRATLSFVIIAASALTALAGDDTTAVALSATPAAAQEVIRSRVGAGHLERIDKSREGAEFTFDVEWTGQTGKAPGFTVAGDGTLLSVEVELSETPTAVQKEIENQASGFELESLDKDVEDANNISYDVEAIKNGQERRFTVADDGTLLSKEITLRETPGPAQEVIQKKTAGKNVTRIDENYDGDISYDVTVSKGEDEKSFTVAANGVLLSEQVDLEAVPEGAQKTVRQRMGDGVVLRVDKSLAEKKKGVLPYEVQGRKDGKPFDFSVGPRGRFLGMDE